MIDSTSTKAEGANEMHAKMGVLSAALGVRYTLGSAKKYLRYVRLR